MCDVRRNQTNITTSISTCVISMLFLITYNLGYRTQIYTIRDGDLRNSCWDSPNCSALNQLVRWSFISLHLTMSILPIVFDLPFGSILEKRQLVRSTCTLAPWMLKNGSLWIYSIIVGAPYCITTCRPTCTHTAFIITHVRMLYNGDQCHSIVSHHRSTQTNISVLCATYI